MWIIDPFFVNCLVKKEELLKMKGYVEKIRCRANQD